MDIFKGAKKRAILEIKDKYTLNDIYFSDEGLTSASANHVAAMASKMAESIKESIMGLRLYERRIRVIGDSENVVEAVNNTLPDICNSVERICKANSLTAWLREAVKEKSDAIEYVSTMSFDEWLKNQNITQPEVEERPKAPAVNFKDIKTILATGFTIKEYNRFMELSSILAVYGEIIHEKGLLTRQIKMLQEIANHPTEVKENGRDTIISSFYYDKNVVNDINAIYTKLQSEYRKLQAEKNGIEAKYSQMAMDYQTREMDNYKKELQKWNLRLADVEAKVTELNNQMKEWKRDTMERLSAMKIVIPNDLKGIYEELREKYL